VAGCLAAAASLIRSGAPGLLTEFVTHGDDGPVDGEVLLTDGDQRVTGSRRRTTPSIDPAAWARSRWTGMALSQVGNAAGEAAHVAGVPRPREPFVPQRSSDDSLLDSIRRTLAPGDPIARLLALWPAPPAQAVGSPPRRRQPLMPATP
jgi:hypothetical protein